MGFPRLDLAPLISLSAICGNMPRVLVVEDDAPLRALLSDELTARGYAVASDSDGRQAMARLANSAFDVVILDRMLPAMDGVDVLRRLRDLELKTPVILLTALGRLPERVEGLEAGADDYIVKPFEIDELHARIRAVLRRRADSGTDDATVSAGDVIVSVARHRVTRAGKLMEMQKTELRLLAELVRNADSVVTRTMLLERVWNYDFPPTTNIVDAYIRRLRQRLEVPGLPDPIVTVRGVGYMFRT
jgi:two-component system, OmpR family, response regulator